MNPNWKNFWQDKLKSLVQKDIKIRQISPVGGGSINQSYALHTNYKQFFIKVNQAGKYPQMFEKEAMGLSLLRENSSFFIPEVYAIEEFEDYSFLLMEFVNSRNREQHYWGNFAKHLAEMHRQSNNQFGLNYNNYVGSLDQNNDFRNSWTAFFVEMRIEPQLKLAIDQQKIDKFIIQSFHKLYERLENYFPAEKPSLVHGDLWSGNFMNDKNGEACIFDPAVYFGHREVDIAMSKLFGGFDQEFYKSYNHHFPMEKDWEERMDLYNLYPLLVHVNLFGGGYSEQVKTILRHSV